MSDDLISRKALMEGRAENDPVRIAAMCAETAFDKEKVIEEIKNLGERFCTSVKCSGDCQNCDHGVMMRLLIEIVEKGGIE